MAINSFDNQFAKTFTGELDKVLVQKSETLRFLDPVMRAKFVGARTVMIPDIDFQGLGNYDRDEGFNRGSVTVTQRPYELQMDRSRSFQIDREDMDELGIANLSGQVLKEFVRTKVAPEVDAYTLSKLFKVAETAGNTMPVTSETLSSSVFALFTQASSQVREAAGFSEQNLIAFINPMVEMALISSPEISRMIRVDDFKVGEITTKVKSLNGVKLIPMSSDRMHSDYTFNAGATAEDAGGFAPTESAKSIAMIMLPTDSASVVRKSETMRIWTPDKNIKADAYKFDYRLYYDAFVKHSRVDTIVAGYING